MRLTGVCSCANTAVVGLTPTPNCGLQPVARNLTFLFLLLSYCVMGQHYRATFEPGNSTQKIDMGVVNLTFTDKTVEITDTKGTRTYPVIYKHANWYVLARDNNRNCRCTDMWIRNYKRRITRIWSSQLTGRFGRITYMETRDGLTRVLDKSDHSFLTNPNLPYRAVRYVRRKPEMKAQSSLTQAFNLSPATNLAD